MTNPAHAMNDSDIPAQVVIDRLGGTTSTAKLCCVTKGAVSHWIRHGIPPARLMFLRLARPDVFADIAPRRRKSDRTT